MSGARTSPDSISRPELPAQFLHDLRTPLNQIIGYSEMLAEQAEEEGQSGFVPDLQKIQAAGRQLLALLGGAALQPPSGVLPDRIANAFIAPTPPRPEHESEAENIAATIHPPASDAPALILVVDDIEANRDVLSRRLQRQGHDVVMAQNGREAMEAVRAQAFDLVLLDIMMPEMDGYEVLQQLKADEALRNIPVIMISALHEIDSVVRCIEMGAEDYLCKPFDPILLKARIGSCLKAKRAHDREANFLEQLQKNYKRLQELEKLRDDLTHMIVHDLRTPLTSVIAGMQTLDLVGDLNDDQREMMDIAVGGGETLLGLINDLLDVEKMESGAMQLRYSRLSPETLIADATGQIASLAESKNLTLVKRLAPELPPFQGDASKLTRTLVNLIGNAIKFTPSEGTITVESHRSEDEISIVFSVSDTGEGIPAESFELIFEKFGQVENRKAGRTMSTGLGLAFCKLAVEAHGGHIAVESTPGKGAKFCYAIPLASPSS